MGYQSINGFYTGIGPKKAILLNLLHELAQFHRLVDKAKLRNCRKAVLQNAAFVFVSNTVLEVFGCTVIVHDRIFASLMYMPLF